MSAHTHTHARRRTGGERERGGEPLLIKCCAHVRAIEAATPHAPTNAQLATATASAVAAAAVVLVVVASL